MISNRPFSIAWFRRGEPDGAYAVDPVTARWLQQFAQGRHSVTVANGAAGVISSNPLVQQGGFVFAADCGSGNLDLISAFAQDDDEAIASSSDDFAMLRLRLNGQSLDLIRDPLGQRSLFYQDNGLVFVASTDLELLLMRPGWRRRLDRAAACHYLAFGTPGLGRTLEAGTRALPAAHALKVQRSSGPFIRRFWSPLSVPGWRVLDDDGRRSLHEELDTAIHDAVTNNDAAMLLSGGIDSGYMAHALNNLGAANRLDAYTIRFTTEGASSECESAAQTAQTASIRHHIVEMTANDAVMQLQGVLGSPQPRSAWSVITYSHLLDAIERNGHQTLLSGLGADEVFGGYSQYMKAYRRFGEFLAANGENDYERGLDDLLAQPRFAADVLFTGIPRFLSDEVFDNVAGPALAGWSHAGETIRFYREAREIRPRAHLFELMIAHECQHRVPDLLLSGFFADAAGRGMRLRYPFLSPRLAGMACRLDVTERFGRIDGVWKNKLALREMTATILPPEVFARPAMTFGAPFLAWIGDLQFRESIEAIVRDESALPDDLIDRKWLSSLFQRVLIQDKTLPSCPEADQLWIVITLASWYRKWIVRPVESN